MHTPFATVRKAGRSRWARRALPGAALALTAALALSACGDSGSGKDASGRTKVTVRTDVFYTGATLPLIVGVEKGIYAKHGLNVTLNPGKGSATTLQTVANGSDDIGYADAGALVQAVGKHMPVEMVAGMVQKSPLAIFARKDSGIRTAKDLAGKTAGFTAGSAAETVFPAYANAAGLNPDSVKFNKVDVPTRDSLFVQGKTQFTFGLLNVTEPNMKVKCNCDLTVLPYASAGLDVLSSGIVTSKKFADHDGAALRKFLTATAEAVNTTSTDPDAAVESFFRYVKTTSLSKEVVKQQWLASEGLLTTDRTKGQPFGCTSADDWQSTIRIMEQHGGVDAGKVTPADAATNAFLSGCSDTLGGK
ncbi:ABC transporter substrate-binding protein [Actinomadura verrucosospora]|uniref:Nitrate ABC transporter substrate-binding protein n=1 Tax=Actinomadura verrucosospora TaxID=46165 RepID=A0A7D3VVI8_ACTVE|nr:ABC transporter substrate-binding protein [Actinomadura verrucosospora]QKG24475.1 nitrate ABC transporter substrate-binding protein [Actinomadura verrucosospora]